MLIRKLFRFENSHVVRGCSTARCKYNLHGHSYEVEVLLEAHALDHGQMVYDFGLLKLLVGELIDSFDHATTLWSGDEAAFNDALRQMSRRWVELPVSPSAEQYARVIFIMVDTALRTVHKNNGESPDLAVHSVIVHETRTGYAQAFAHDIANPKMGLIDSLALRFSEDVRASWRDPMLWEKLLAGTPLRLPDEIA